MIEDDNIALSSIKAIPIRQPLKHTGAVNKGKLQESIVTLYLRLNGYFTTSLIVHHSEVGKNTTDLDVLAVRFPWHSQPDRQVGSAPELECPDAGIDLIIGEVKSVGEPLQFN